MSWTGSFVFGKSSAAYCGPAADNTLHAHAAIQLVLAEAGAATIIGADGEEFVGAAVLIRPLVEHSLSSRGEVTLLYAEPQLHLAFRLANLASHADICVIDVGAVPKRRPLEELDQWLARVAGSFDTERSLDVRLERALAKPSLWLPLQGAFPIRRTLPDRCDERLA